MFDNITWKSKRLFFCKTPGLPLWCGLALVQIRHIEQRSETQEDTKKMLRAFPKEIDPTCRCRDCRYVRMTRNWSNV